LRHHNRYEQLGREKVVLARLVDDPNHRVLFGHRVAHRKVDFAFLQGRAVAPVVDAENEGIVTH